VIGVANEFTTGVELRESVLMVDDVKAVARTDGDGRFELDEPVIGSVFMATTTGSGPVLFDRDWLGRTRDAPFVIALAPSATLEARITDRVGAPKPGVEIRLVAYAFEATRRHDLPDHRIFRLMVGTRRVTDDNGQATIAGIPPLVPFDVEIWSDSSRLRRTSTEIVFEPGQEISKEWRLGSGRTVRGRVVDDAEQPVAGKKLLLTQRVDCASLSTLRAALQWEDEGKATQDLRTDADGRFSIDDVGPGKWWLGIAPPKPSWLGSKPVDLGALAPVAVPFDVDADRDPIDLLLHAHRGLYIRGRTVDPDGSPVLASLTATATADGSRFFASASADGGTGEFAIGPLEPGEYRLEARPFPIGEFRNSGSPPGPPLAPIDNLLVRAGREDLVITFGLGGSIRATARRADTGTEAAATFWLAPTENLNNCHVIVRQPVPSTSSRASTGSYVVSRSRPTAVSAACATFSSARAADRRRRSAGRTGGSSRAVVPGTDEDYAQVSIVAAQRLRRRRNQKDQRDISRPSK
jgi:hypothetical protein